MALEHGQNNSGTQTGDCYLSGSLPGFLPSLFTRSEARERNTFPVFSRAENRKFTLAFHQSSLALPESRKAI